MNQFKTRTQKMIAVGDANVSLDNAMACLPSSIDNLQMGDPEYCAHVCTQLERLEAAARNMRELLALPVSRTPLIPPQN